MPKYEIFQQDKVTYRKTYVALDEAHAWALFHMDRYYGGLQEIDSDVLYSEIEEVSEDA